MVKRLARFTEIEIFKKRDNFEMETIARRLGNKLY